MLANNAQTQWCRIARAVCFTNRRSLLGGEGQAACPGSAIEAADHSVLALAGGLEVVDVRLRICGAGVTLQTQPNCYTARTRPPPRSAFQVHDHVFAVTSYRTIFTYSYVSQHL